MKWLKLKIWLFRYALEFRKRTGWTIVEAWHYGEATQENFNYDLEDLNCPKSMVGEDLSCWSD